MRTSVDDTHRRPRVLLVAYGCAADRGSEAGVGWNRVVQAARFCQVHVICEESEFGEGVRRHLREHDPAARPQFHFVAQRRWESQLWRLPALGYVAYNLWQRRALRLARQLHQQHAFDLVHQVNFSTYREPGYLWKLEVPFVWGPFGGAQNYPARFLSRAGFRGALGEALRSVCNRLQLRFGRRIGRAARRADVLLAANSTTQRDCARVWGVEPRLFPDTGIAEVAGAPPAKPASGRSSGPLKILWVGRLVPIKALWLLIEALAQLPPEVAYELRVVGSGPQQQRWQRLARRKGIEPRTTWIAEVSHRETLQQYRWADLFVFTSLRDTTGTVMLEALGAGLPVVCLDHHGAHDAVTDRCGIKIPVTRPQEAIARLADAVALLARDVRKREQLGRGAIQRARQYVWSRQGDEMAALYRQVLEAAGSPIPRRADGLIHCRRRLGSSMAVPLDGLLGSRAEGRFGILMYHRVADVPGGNCLPEGTVPVERFRRQMRVLLSRGYTPWPLRRVLEHHTAGRPIPPKTFVVTFDDGYECVYHDAWPVLSELRIPATVFVVTSHLDGDRPLAFDSRWPGRPGHGRGTLWRSLSTAQCREMLAGGLVELGSHTHAHADFRGRPEAFRADLRASLEVLRQRFDLAEATFAFPFGHSSPRLVAEAERAGVLCALTTRHELVAPQTAVFDWGRFSVETYDSGATLAAKLDGWYSVLQDTWYWWQRKRRVSEVVCR
ncbi:MAG: glycosyltransferase [Pirellulales bacterium]|nr:glycosyltransferase [Pirellulales bacterium]